MVEQLAVNQLVAGSIPARRAGSLEKYKVPFRSKVLMPRINTEMKNRASTGRYASRFPMRRAYCLTTGDMMVGVVVVS